MSEKNLKGNYTSFADIRSEFGLKEIRTQTKDKKKLDEQRNKFRGKHICPACKQPMSYIDGTNLMVCSNSECNGIKHEEVNEETGEKKVWYDVSYHNLDNVGAVIASNIFKN